MAGPDREERILRAGEYVLGTLDVEARTAFETQLRDSVEARQLVAYWEQRLGALGFALAPEPPPEAVWQRIASEIGAAASNETSSAAGSAGTAVGLWRGLAIAASVAAIALAATLFTRVEPGGQPAPASSAAAPAYASMVYDEDTGMSWLVTAEAHSHTMSVLAMGDYDVPEGKILRLWFKPDDSDPILVGRWPHASGRHEMKVSDRIAQAMDKPAKLIVSLEDSSLAGLPTPAGKVMWVSPVARRSS